MSSPVQEYIDLYKKLMARRATNPISEIGDDKILDELDVSWRKMTDEERVMADDRLNEWEKSSDNHPGRAE